MIELFRHEAMNQATVIAGFCEIIENLLLKEPGAGSQEFLSVLHKVEKLIRLFNQTLAEFRDESMEYDSQANNRAGGNKADIGSLLSATCRIHYGVLREIAGEIFLVTNSIRLEEIGSSNIVGRYQFVLDAASRLYTLFTDPATFLQKASVENQPMP